MNRSRYDPEKTRGAALLIALVASLIASVLAVGLIERGQKDLARMHVWMNSERAWQFAQGMDALTWRMLEEAVASGQDAAALDGLWTAPFEVPAGSLRGRLLDQQGKFNVNSLSQADPARAESARAQFSRLLAVLGANPALAAELADWIDAGAGLRQGGATDMYYAARRPPYRTSGRLLAHVSEMRWLRSMDADTWRALAPYLAALPDPDTPVNVNTASAEVLHALFDSLDLAAARSLVAAAPHESVLDFLAREPLSAYDPTLFAPLLTVNSSWYIAHAQVELDGILYEYHRMSSRAPAGYDFRLLSQGPP